MAGGDLAAVLALHRAAFPRHSTARFLQRALYPTYLAALSSGFGVVALDAQRPIGFCVGALDDARFHRTLLRAHPGECVLAFLRNHTARSAVHLGRVAGRGARLHFSAVAEEKRGAGVGRSLLESAVDMVRAAGCGICRARLHSYDLAWQRLHERLGFLPAVQERATSFIVYRLDFDRLTKR